MTFTGDLMGLKGLMDTRTQTHDSLAAKFWWTDEKNANEQFTISTIDIKYRYAKEGPISRDTRRHLTVLIIMESLWGRALNQL